MSKPSAHDFALYLKDLLQARAQREMEPLRLLLAQYRSILDAFPPLQEEATALLQVDAGRDYELVTQNLRQGLQGLEKLLRSLEKAQAEWGDEAIDRDYILGKAELYSSREAQQQLQHLQTTLKLQREREKRVAAEKAERRRQEVEEQERKSAPPATMDLMAAAKPRRPRRQHNTSTTLLVEEVERKLQSMAERQFEGWQKVGAQGEELPASALQWAAVIDRRSSLMWAVNWQVGDTFPNRGELTWYNPKASDNGGDAGSENAGNNTSAWVERVNRDGWCGYHDWRLPSVEELKTLLTVTPYQYYHIREDVFTDMQYLGSRFWSSSPDAGDRDYARVVYFGYGHDGSALKSYLYYVRLVRDVPALS